VPNQGASRLNAARAAPIADGKVGEGYGRHAFCWERRVYGCSDAFRSGTTARALVS